jgi:hypothetical protein
MLRTHILFAVTASVALTAGCKRTFVRNVYCDGNVYLCGDPANPVCDLSRNLCIPAMDGGIDGGSDFGDAGDGGDLAMPCSQSSECPGDTPICEAPMCRACAGMSDDAECALRNSALPRCQVGGANAGRCVACRPASQGQDCPASTPICSADGTCRGCRAHAECPSEVCVMEGATAGQCAPENQVSYVNNAASGCISGNGARSTPVCEVSTALGLGRPFVYVKGSATAYGPVSVVTTTTTFGPITVVGPGRSAAQTARIVGVTTPGIAVSTNGMPATIRIDGLEVTGAGGGTPSAGLKCSVTTGAASVTVVNSAIKSSGAAGVDSAGCAMSLNANIISGNTGGGVSLGGTGNYTVTNNIIAGNGNVAPGVTIASTATGTFAFNTVAGNTVTAGVSGIDCGGGAMKSIQNSIIASNASGNGGPQLGTNCSTTGVVTSAVEFVSVSDFHLKANSATNAACCVDKVANPTTPNATVDVDGSARPKGVAHDIGAHEVQ